MKEYDSVESLLADEESRGIHIECSTAVSEQVREVVRQRYGQRRCAFMLCDELGFERESVRSYLMMFARIAGRVARRSRRRSPISGSSSMRKGNCRTALRPSERLSTSLG